MKSMHLDTNVLILTFGESSKIRKELEIQLAKGYQLYISAFVWHEFVSGPVAEIQKQYAMSLVEERIVPLDKEIAELGAQLYNSSGRKRGSHPDCLIAATAICSGGKLFTQNPNDFQSFLNSGLELHSVIQNENGG